MGIVACAALLAISASPATAQNATEKRADQFVKRQAKIVLENQPAVFPNSHITKKTFGNIACLQDTLKRRRIECIFSVGIEETWIGATLPSTIRFCKTPKGKPFEHALRLRLQRSGQLRLVDGWKMSCQLDQFGINLWNKYAEDHQKYQPIVTESTPYEEVPAAPEISSQPLPHDLVIPSGAPSGPPPGPLYPTGNYRSSSRAEANARAGNETFAGCSRWNQYHIPQSYAWTYACFWNVHSYPGFAIGYGNNITRYEQYVYLGRDYLNRNIAQLWASGTY